MSLDVSKQLHDAISNMADDLNTSKSDVLKRALVFLEVVNDARKDGYKFGLAENTDSFDREIVGIFKGH
jgi:predicted transcriptional regulator